MREQHLKGQLYKESQKVKFKQYPAGSFKAAFHFLKFILLYMTCPQVIDHT